MRGKLVAVKPNETWAVAGGHDRRHPADTLRGGSAGAEALRARELVVSGGAGAAETEEVFRDAGLMDVIEQEGDHLRPQPAAVRLGRARLRAGRPMSTGPQRAVMVNPGCWSTRP